MDSELITLHIFGADVSAAATWRLLAWCRAHGAAEFTVDGIATGPGPHAIYTEFDRLADPHKLPPAVRRRLSGPSGGDLVRATDLWALNDETETLLRSVFPGGLFHDAHRAEAWFEDPTVYRAGEVVLGVITHESEGVLRVTPDERLELDRLGVPYHSTGRWVGY